MRAVVQRPEAVQVDKVMVTIIKIFKTGQMAKMRTVDDHRADHEAELDDVQRVPPVDIKQAFRCFFFF